MRAKKGLYRPEREHDNEDYLVKRAHQLGGIALKFRTPPRMGAPDRIVILPGPRIGWIETKHPDGGKPEPGQPGYQAMLRRHGCFVAVCKNREEIEDALRTIASLPPMYPPVLTYLDELLK